MTGWQPIKTARKDGTWMLLKGGEMDSHWDRGSDASAPPCVVGYFSEKHTDDYYDSPWRFASYDGGLYGGYSSPTHWMPLPER